MFKPMFSSVLLLSVFSCTSEEPLTKRGGSASSFYGQDSTPAQEKYVEGLEEHINGSEESLGLSSNDKFFHGMKIRTKPISTKKTRSDGTAPASEGSENLEKKRSSLDLIGSILGEKGVSCFEEGGIPSCDGDGVKKCIINKDEATKYVDPTNLKKNLKRCDLLNKNNEMQAKLMQYEILFDYRYSDSFAWDCQIEELREARCKPKEEASLGLGGLSDMFKIKPERESAAGNASGFEKAEKASFPEYARNDLKQLPPGCPSNGMPCCGPPELGYTPCDCLAPNDIMEMIKTGMDFSEKYELEAKMVGTQSEAKQDSLQLGNYTDSSAIRYARPKDTDFGWIKPRGYQYEEKPQIPSYCKEYRGGAQHAQKDENFQMFLPGLNQRVVFNQDCDPKFQEKPSNDTLLQLIKNLTPHLTEKCFKKRGEEPTQDFGLK